MSSDLALGRLKLISCFTSARAPVSAWIAEKNAQTFITFVQFSSLVRIRLAIFLDVKHEINFKWPYANYQEKMLHVFLCTSNSHSRDE